MQIRNKASSTVSRSAPSVSPLRLSLNLSKKRLQKDEDAALIETDVPKSPIVSLDGRTDTDDSLPSLNASLLLESLDNSQSDFPSPSHSPLFVTNLSQPQKELKPSMQFVQVASSPLNASPTLSPIAKGHARPEDHQRVHEMSIVESPVIQLRPTALPETAEENTMHPSKDFGPDENKENKECATVAEAAAPAAKPDPADAMVKEVVSVDIYTLMGGPVKSSFICICVPMMPYCELCHNCRHS